MSKTAFTINVPFKKMEGFGGGFRQEWITAKPDNGEFVAGIDSGAGLGNPLITFWIEEKGQQRRSYTASVADLLEIAIDIVRGNND